jgi:hypothetical protein
MHPAVQLLTSVMRPPVRGGEQIDWPALEGDLGFSLPSDYRSFVEVYGGGTIDQILSIAPIIGDDAPWSVASRAEDYEIFNDPLTGEDLEDPMHWGLGGLIPWGAAGADQCYWYAADSSSDQWSMVVWRPRHTVEWMQYSRCFVDFLVDIIRGDVEPPFGQHFPLQANPDFMSWNDRERLRAARISPVAYGRDPHAVITRIQAAGLDPVEFFASADRYL